MQPTGQAAAKELSVISGKAVRSHPPAAVVIGEAQPLVLPAYFPYWTY